jgi:hypothetical protein
MNLFADLLLFRQLVMLKHHLCSLPAALSCADLFLAAGGVVVFCLVVEDKTDQAGVHLIAEAQGVTDVHELFDEGTAFTEGAL